MKVLIVEDEPIILALLEKHIQMSGHEVTICENAEMALQAYHNTFYPLILLDLGLPGMNGFEFCRCIRALPQAEYSMVLVITAYDRPEDIENALDAGADDYLVKPVSLEQLRVRLTIIERRLQNNTQRKWAEEALRQEKDTAQRYFNIAGVILVVINADHTVTRINTKGCEILGYPEHEIVGKNWFDTFLPKRSREQLINTFSQLIAGDTAQEEYVENSIVTKTGKEKIVAWHNTLLRDEQGNIIATLSSGEDITERKLAEQALRHSEQQYRLLAEHAVDGIAIICGMAVVFANKTLSSMFEAPAEQLSELHRLLRVRDDYKEAYQKKLTMFEQGHTDQHWQAPCLTFDDREIWVDIRHSRIHWQGSPAMLVTIRDITQNKLREIAIEKEKAHLQQVNIALRSTMKDRYKFGDIVGKSFAMQQVYERVLNAAASDTNIVIYGESGTGKELVAWTIHYLSERKEKPFAPINCGAIPENLFESEFFGYRRGAFTGAYQDRAGFLDSTHGGTLFLDEVGELTPVMQAKLLRALAGDGHTPVGSRSVRKTDVRIIAATNKNLEEFVRQGFMREDFFFRIHVVPIHLPPLRERREDIPLLIDHFLTQHNRDLPKPVLPGTVLKQLYDYDWPGNVRELQNVLQRYFTTKQLDFGTLRSQKTAAASDVSIPHSTFPNDVALREAIQEYEKQYLITILDRYHWHRGNTAKALKIGQKTLYRKMKEYQLL